MATASAIKEIVKKEPGGLIARAYAFAEKAHKGQLRKSGEPYFVHPLAAAEILHTWHLDDATIAAGLLHDTVEDTGVPLETIKKEFGDEVAFLVDGVTKLGHIKYRGAENETTSKAENLRKMVLALSEDLRVVFIKLADRLHNMQTLGALPPAKQKRIALETDEIYASLAYRLGMHNLSGELQDLAFPYMFPQEYRWLLSISKEHYEQRLKYLEKIKPEVEALLTKHGIKPLDIEIRAKRYSSLYKKLLKRDMDMGRIFDLVAMRVIVDTLPECYAALGVIHEMWPPLPRRIKDYIAMPKPNAYRSLHTTVIGPGGKTIEIQIRTQAMHDENEYGVAAHWLYKQRQAGGAPKGGERISGQKLAAELKWVQQLKNWQEQFTGQTTDPEEFMRSMKIDFFQDRIFAVTPRGDVFDLPAGATPIDFAYHIHSEIGNSAIGARVNGVVVPLDHALKSGDVVTIVTQKGKKPSEDWLRFVKTTVAMDHIRLALRKKMGSPAWVAAKAPSRAELKITVVDRVGLIKDLSGVIAQARVAILSFHTESAKGGKLHLNRVEIQTGDRKKIEKIAARMKEVEGVREVSYKVV
ncbi:MAG: RelA/SpoT family protein [Candidatus Pacebacteria bacterium]|nr:RelA/SpoT family protein [Candidatus Paceibacterota bacterium]